MNAGVHYRIDPRTTTFGPMTSGLRWVYFVIAGVAILGFFGAVALWSAAIVMRPDDPDKELIGVGTVVLFATIMLVYVKAFLGMAWLYRAWGWLPWDQRYSQNWKGWISPAQAALLLLVPYFQYYWMFVINTALCDAFDRLRVRYPTSEAAPKTLAIAACVMQIIVPLPIGVICWAIYMSKIEAMSREMSAAAVTRGQLAF